MADEVPLAGDVLDHALALQDLQGPGRDPVGDLVVLRDRMRRGDTAGHGPLCDLVAKLLGYLLIRRHRRVRVDHRASIPVARAIGKLGRPPGCPGLASERPGRGSCWTLLAVLALTVAAVPPGGGIKLPNGSWPASLPNHRLAFEIDMSFSIINHYTVSWEYWY